MFPQQDADDRKSVQEMREVRHLCCGSEPLQANTPQERWQVEPPLLFTFLFSLFTFCSVQISPHKFKAHVLTLNWSFSSEPRAKDTILSSPVLGSWLSGIDSAVHCHGFYWEVTNKSDLDFRDSVHYLTEEETEDQRGQVTTLR